METGKIGRSSGSISQWHAARTDRNWLEKGQQAGPRMGSGSTNLKLTFHLDHSAGAGQLQLLFQGVEAGTVLDTGRRKGHQKAGPPHAVDPPRARPPPPCPRAAA